VPEGRMAVNDHMRMKLAPVAQDDELAQDTVGTDLAIRAKLRAWMNDGGGMDDGHS